MLWPRPRGSDHHEHERAAIQRAPAVRAEAPPVPRGVRAGSRVIPGGVAQVMRGMQPFPIAIARGKGARKWDVDGNEYVDYHFGSGALLLGHAHPEVVAAIQEAVTDGWQNVGILGSNPPYELTSPGVTPGESQDVVIMPANDADLVAQTLDADPE